MQILRVFKQKDIRKILLVVFSIVAIFIVQKYAGFFRADIFKTGENCFYYTDKIDSDSFQEGVVVAVIDSGIDFANNNIDQILAKNEAELKGKKGVDDDQNGYVDDFYGWDFVGKNNKPHDSNGHGTAIGGVLHFNFKNKILPLKITGEGNKGSLKAVLSAIEYAIDNGAKVINLSVGTKNNYSSLEKVIKKAVDKGIIVVSAVGNDEGVYYPASYPGVISVGTSTQNKNADINTLGTNICVMGLNNRYSNMGGSSLATPFVSGYISQLVISNTDYSLEKLTEQAQAVFNDKKDVDLITFNTNSLIQSDTSFETVEASNSSQEEELIKPEEMTEEELKNYFYLVEESKIYKSKKLSKYDVVKLIIIKAGLKPLKTKQVTANPFVDVPYNTVMAKYVAKAKSLKFITGDEQNLFYPKATIKEIEVIAMLSDLYLWGDLSREFYLYNKLNLDKKAEFSPYLVSAYNLGLYTEEEIKKSDYNDSLQYEEFIELMAKVSYLYYQEKVE